MPEKIVKPEVLNKTGVRFRLTGEASNSAECDDKHIYEVINWSTTCTLGVHLMVKNEEGLEQEMKIMPWVPVILIEE